MKRIVFLICVLPVLASAQLVRYDAPFPSVSPQYSPLLQANLAPASPVIAVCHSPANQVPCTNYVTTFTYAGVACANGAQDVPQPATTSACQTTGDAQGNIGFWAPAGTYDYTVTIGTTSFGPYTVTLGGAGGGSGVTGVTSGGFLALANSNTTVGLEDCTLSSQVPQWNGSTWACATLSGGGNVSTSPGSNQNIVQPSGSQFSTNNLSQITYVTASDNWQQSPSGSLSIGSNTVTLTPCPRGIMTPATAGTVWFTTPWTWVHIAGTGTAEDAVITATTCTQGGGASGTITFTAAGSHAAGYTLQSSSQGVQEAINAAMVLVPGYTVYQGGHTIVPPLSTIYQWTARVSIPGRQARVQFMAGARVACGMSDTCLYIGDPSNVNAAEGVIVDRFQFDSIIALNQHPAIEDHGESVRINDAEPFYDYQRASGSSFSALIQVDTDEDAIIDHLDTTIYSGTSSGSSHCGTDFCEVAIYLPSGAAPLAFVKHLGLSLGCTMNGIDNQGGNVLRVSDSVVQAYPQFGIRSVATYDNDPNVEEDNVYEEAGCAGSNPLKEGTAGLIVEGGYASVRNSTGPSGALPVYANTGTSGSTQYNYYIVAHCSGGGCGGGLVSAPFLAGIALTNGSSGTITVVWPQIGTTGTVTYDVIRAAGTANEPAPYTAVCTGGSTTTCGSVATGLAQGSTCAAVGSFNVCSYSDTVTATTASYTVGVPSYYIGLPFWPGAAIYTTPFDTVGSGSSTSGITFDRMGDNVAASGGNPVSQMVSSYGALVPKFFALNCASLFGGTWQSCLENDVVPGGATNGATLFDTGGPIVDAPGLKGRLILEEGLVNEVTNGERITIVDANPAKTLASAGLRPSQDANDTYIGLDQAASGTASSNAQLAFGAPVSISEYIGSTPNNSSYLERLTSSVKTFEVVVNNVAGLQQNGTALAIGCGTTTSCAATATPLAHFVWGMVALTSGSPSTAVVTGISPAFTSTSTYGCTVTNQTTAADTLKVANTSASSITITGPNTVTDTVSYICIGT